MLLSATVYSIAMVAQKVVLRRIPALQVTWLACLIGTVACLPFAGALVRDLSVAPTLQILGVVYLGLVPTALAFSTWAYALSHTLGRKAGCHDLRGATDHHPARVALPQEVPPMLAIVGGALSPAAWPSRG